MIADIKSVGSGSPVNINWELVSHCQYNCSYCYYKPFKSQTDYASLAKIVLAKLNTIKDQTKVTLLGGEPTLHPTFLEVIGRLHSMEHISQICIVTNFLKPLPFWQELAPYKDKLKITISYHPEYIQKDMFEKILALQDEFLLDFVFIVHNDPQYLVRMQETAEKLDLVNRNKISVNFVKIHDKAGYKNYPDTIQRFMEEEQEKLRSYAVTETVDILTSQDTKKVPKFDIINHGLNNFEGWSCQLRAFIIKEDGFVASACVNKQKYILQADFSGSEVICPHKICECDDYWSFTKTNPGASY